MKLSKYEKETIILTNEEDRYYSVYTFNQGLQKRLKNFAERYPECCYLSNSTKEGSETYIIQKGRLSLNLRPPYAKERIQKALETIQMAREEKSKRFIKHDLSEKYLMTMRKTENKRYSVIKYKGL